MRILLVHNFYQCKGGEDIVFQQEKKLLVEHNHLVDTFTVSNDEIHGLSKKLKSALNVIYSRSSRSKLQAKIAEFSPDIIHVHNFFPLLTPAVYDACIEAGTPVIQTLHNYRITCAAALLLRKGHICEKCVTGTSFNGFLYRCYRNSFWGSLLVSTMIYLHRKRETWTNKVNQFITLTEFSKKKFIESGINSDKLTVKPNFCTPQDNHSQTSGPADEPYALYVGRLSQEKGIHTLKNAWRNLTIPLRVIGDGPMFSSFQSEKSDTITLLGHLPPPNVRKEMSKASFLIIPSVCYEMFPLTIIEAFSCSLPVIAANIGSMAEIVEENKTGLFFSPGNPKELADKVTWLYSHPDECRQMGENALLAYTTKYTPTINYEMLIKIYDKVLLPSSHRG